MATQLSGANKERSAWLAKIKRLQHDFEWSVETNGLLAKLREWGLKRNERYNSRKGGLQR